MILVGKDTISAFIKKHAQSKNPLAAWEKLVNGSHYVDFNQLRKTFPSADYVHHQYTIFNIGGNKYRLIAEINYEAQVICVCQLWTHAEYSLPKNQNALKRGAL